MYKRSQSFLLLVVLMLFSGSVSAQEKYLNNPSKKMADAISYSLENYQYFIKDKLDSLKTDAEFLIEEGIKSENQYAVNLGKRSLGSYLIRTGDPERGITYLKEAEAYFSKSGDFDIEAEVLNDLGNGYMFWGKPVYSERYYLKSLKIGKKGQDPVNAILAMPNLAQAYMQLSQLDKAEALLLTYKKVALSFKRYQAVSNAYALLGTIAWTKGNKPLGMEYYQKSASFGFKSSSQAQIAHAYTNMAIFYYESGDYNKSLDYFQKALVIREKTGNSKNISESYYNLGDYYAGLGEYTKAIQYYQQSEDFCKTKNLIKGQLDAGLAIAETLKETGQLEKAYDKLQRCLKFQDQYYKDMALKKSDVEDLLVTIHQLEEDKRLQKQESNFENLMKKQNYHTITLYITILIAVIALVVLMFYSRKIA